jgi:hypothetical protein
MITRVMAASGSARWRATTVAIRAAPKVSPMTESRPTPTIPRRPKKNSEPPRPTVYTPTSAQNQSRVGFGWVEKSAMASRGARPPQRRYGRTSAEPTPLSTAACVIRYRHSASLPLHCRKLREVGSKAR